MKKNKKGQTIYSEEIYWPCEFRTRKVEMSMFPTWIACDTGMTMMEYCEAAARCVMPVLLTGWVQDEVHLQWGHQSLN